MSDSKRLIRPTISILLVVATALGLYNVYGDDAEVTRLAEQAACGTEKCSVTTLRRERSAFSQGFSFQTTLETKGKPTVSVDVSCTRSLILLGDYTCAKR
jgi:hypothetical protein